MTTHDLVELLLKRLDRQDEMLDGLDKKLDEHIRIDGDLRPALEEMAEMWGRSKAVAWFFTKLAGFVAVGIGSWEWVRNHIKL